MLCLRIIPLHWLSRLVSPTLISREGFTDRSQQLVTLREADFYLLLGCNVISAIYTVSKTFTIHDHALSAVAGCS